MQPPIFTDIDGTDYVSDSRELINDNFDTAASAIANRVAAYTNVASVDDLVDLATATILDVAHLVNGDVYQLRGSNPGVLSNWVKRPVGSGEAPMDAVVLGVLADGTDQRANIIAAVAEAKSAGVPLYFPTGVYRKAGDAIPLPSNIELIFAPDAIVRSLPNVNAAIFTNDDHTNGNSGIVIRGGQFDGNMAQQTQAFSTLDFTRVSFCQFLGLTVSGGLRTGTFPDVSSDGEGLVLRDSNYNTIDGGSYSYNAYDGIKLRTSHHNVVSNIVAIDNGRSGLQISKTTDAALGTTGADYNVVSNFTVLHSTGVPHSGAPTTSGVYIHVGAFNTVSNLTVEGCRQGIGLVEGSCDNTFVNASLRTRGGFKAAIEIEQLSGAPANARNSFVACNSRPLSGAAGHHVNLVGANNTKLIGCHFSIGSGSGTWKIEIGSSSKTTQVIGGQASSSPNVIDSGTDSMFDGFQNMTAGTDTHNYGFGAANVSDWGGGNGVVAIPMASTVPSSSWANGFILFGDPTTGLRVRSPSGSVTTLAPL